MPADSVPWHAFHLMYALVNRQRVANPLKLLTPATRKSGRSGAYATDLIAAVEIMRAM